MTTTATATTPNLYELSGKHLHVTYATSGIDGQPHFTYQDAHRTLSFRGNDIRVLETELGTLVSVSLQTSVDMGGTTFSLLLPRVNLDGPGSAAVATSGITTIHRRSPIPALNHGQLDRYTVASLTGTARAVMF